MFKLVQIDEEKHEVPLAEGKQVIGRGQMHGCDDKRISRSHAEIETTVDTVTIKALHTNPCFFVNKNMTEAKIINQNCIVIGNHGDKIGFLPDTYWFEITCNGINDDGPDIKQMPSMRSLLQTCKDLLESSNNVKDEEASDNKLADSKLENVENSRLVPRSPSILSDDKNQVLTHEQNEPTSQPPGKRCLIKAEPVSPPDVKKVKKEENAEDDTPKCSSAAVQTGSSSASANNNNSSPPRKEQRPGRERCMYGADCYRKNPQHKTQFSHPGDADWGAGQQAPCPWGYACARRDPRHWRDHTHPYGMQPPLADVQKKKTHVVQRNGKVIFVNAHSVSFYDDHFEAEDSDGESVDYDYEFN